MRISVVTAFVVLEILCFREACGGLPLGSAPAGSPVENAGAPRLPPAYLGFAAPVFSFMLALAACVFRSTRRGQPRGTDDRNNSPESSDGNSLPVIVVGTNPMHRAMRESMAAKHSASRCQSGISVPGPAAAPRPAASSLYLPMRIMGRLSSANPGASALRGTSSVAGLTTSTSDQSLSALIQHDHLPAHAGPGRASTGSRDSPGDGVAPRSPTLRAIPEGYPVCEAAPEAAAAAGASPPPGPLDHSIRDLVAQLKAAAPLSPSLGPMSSPPRAPPPLVDPSSSIPTLVADLRAAQLDSQRRIVVAKAEAARAAAKKPAP